MNTAIRRFFLYVGLLLFPLTVGCLRVKPSPPPLPPSPDAIARLIAAKKIFLSNAGADSNFTHDIPGGANVSYNELYASFQQWGHFQLVDSAAQADLVFEIRGAERLADVDHTGRGLSPDDYTVTKYPPMLNLSILDPSTKDTLYKIVLPAGRGPNIPKGKIAFTQSIELLTDKIKTLVFEPAATQNQ